MEFTFRFVQLLFTGFYLASPLFMFLGSLIVVSGLIAGRMEGWSRFDALYWAFITALTVGYGDIRPLRRRTKVLAIGVTLVGFMFSGIFVSLTLNAALKAFKKHMDVPGIEAIR